MAEKERKVGRLSNQGKIRGGARENISSLHKRENPNMLRRERE